jgi:hypothetical protein
MKYNKGSPGTIKNKHTRFPIPPKLKILKNWDIAKTL